MSNNRCKYLLLKVIRSKRQIIKKIKNNQIKSSHWIITTYHLMMNHTCQTSEMTHMKKKMSNFNSLTKINEPSLSNSTKKTMLVKARQRSIILSCIQIWSYHQIRRIHLLTERRSLETHMIRLNLMKDPVLGQERKVAFISSNNWIIE